MLQMVAAERTFGHSLAVVVTDKALVRSGGGAALTLFSYIFRTSTQALAVYMHAGIIRPLGHGVQSTPATCYWMTIVLGDLWQGYFY